MTNVASAPPRPEEGARLGRRRLLLLLLLASPLAACGKRGRLELPPPQPPAEEAE